MKNREVRKLGLKETRANNENLIVQELLKHDGMSRVELAETTGLSASTVTSLTSELIQQGVLRETGERVGTAGRSRVGLTVSDSLGYLVILELSHDRVFLTALSMHLETLASKRLPGRFVDGNSVLAAAAKEILSRQDGVPLAGIGILFQEDIRPNDFSVMYSTGYEAANISLADALRTQFRVPVFEELGAAFTLNDALREVDAQERNLAHIQLGKTIRTVVRIDGSTVPLRDHFAEDFSALLPVPAEAQGQGILSQLSLMLNLLYAMFQLDMVLIASTQGLPEPLLQRLRESVDPRLTGGRLPEILAVAESSRSRVSRQIAESVRSSTLRKCLGCL